MVVVRETSKVLETLEVYTFNNRNIKRNNNSILTLKEEMMKTNIFVQISVLLVLMIGISLTGCSGNKTQNDAQQETQQEAQQVENEVSQVLPAAEKEDEKEKILVTFIELGSVRCIPCQKMVPIMESVEEKYGDQVEVVFHDVWTPEGKPYGEKYGIRSIPTQIFLDENGEEFFRHVGFFPEDELVEVLKSKGVK